MILVLNHKNSCFSAISISREIENKHLSFKCCTSTVCVLLVEMKGLVSALRLLFISALHHDFDLNRR